MKKNENDISRRNHVVEIGPNLWLYGRFCKPTDPAKSPLVSFIPNDFENETRVRRNNNT